MKQSNIDRIEKKLDDIDSDLYQEICLNINEAAFSEEQSHGIEGQDGSIYISEVVELNACNHAITGAFWFHKVKYSFEVQVGDWRGFEWQHLSDKTDIPVVSAPAPTIWALQPSPRLVSIALSAGTGSNLVSLWDATAAREPYVSIPGNYSYDRRVQPGEQVEKYWSKKAADGGFEIVSEEMAKETRRLLYGDRYDG